MKCARCLWRGGLSKKKVESARDAVTIYDGNALCAEHFGYARVQRGAEGKNPWAPTKNR